MSIHCSRVKVEALVLENANCTMLNVSGHTPLDLACQSGHAQVHVHVYAQHTVCEVQVCTV